MNYKEKISNDLSISFDYYDEILKASQIKIKKFRLKKKLGGYRYIHSPDVRIKLLQYWLIDNVFQKLPIHPSAYAFKKNTSVLDNAKRHLKNKYFITIDFRDFFPSIKFTDFEKFVIQYNEKKHKKIFNQELIDIIRTICFYKDFLPIGYPTSPILSNIMMFDFDNQIIEYTKSKDCNLIYSRYADDIVISTNIKYRSKEVYQDVKKIILNYKNPELLINFKKVKFLSSTSGSAYVTGLKINPGNNISINKKKKDHIRLLLSLYIKKGLNDKELESLTGYLSYIRYVDPKFYTKLQEKYFKAINDIYNKVWKKSQFTENNQEDRVK